VRVGLFEELAERRIAEAIARGDLDGLRGEGKPLQLDDDAGVPPELRVAYRVLKNAGYVPPEVELRREIAALVHLLGDIEDAERAAAARRLAMLRTRLASVRRRESTLLLDDRYKMKLLHRLATDAVPPA
jgi:hypothetical protein